MGWLSAIQALTPTTFKSWILFVLTIISGAGGIAIYNVAQSDQVKEYLLKLVDRNELKARFCEEAFESQANELINVLGAKAVVVWVTDLSGTTANKTVLYALDSNHKSKMTESWVGKTSPIYATNQSRIDITRLLEGAVICGRFEVFSDIGTRIVRETHSDWFCSSPVPPTSGHMIGVITAYFDKEPDVSSALMLEMRKASKGIVYE